VQLCVLLVERLVRRLARFEDVTFVAFPDVFLLFSFQVRGALRDFSAALALAPSHCGALLGRARLAALAGRHAVARHDALCVLRLQPRSVPAMLLAAQVDDFLFVLGAFLSLSFLQKKNTGRRRLVKSVCCCCPAGVCAWHRSQMFRSLDSLGKAQGEILLSMFFL
jgi:hypothetical protein